MVAVPRGIECVGVRARALHETATRLILMDFSNAFNVVNRTAVLTEVVVCVTVLTPFGTSATAKHQDVLLPVDSGVHRTIACSGGMQ